MTDRRILVLRTVLLWILLELLAAAQVRAPDGRRLLWSWARTAVAPLVLAGETLGTVVGDVVTGVSDTTGLVVANRELQRRLETAEAFNLIMAEDMAVRLELESMTGLIPDLAAVAVPARVTYRDLARGRMIALVSPPRRVANDTPAIAAHGVIGRVIRSERGRCWLELITHPVAAVAVQTPDGGVLGLAVGSDAGDLVVQFVPRQAELLRGDELVTSGADGIYPPGLPVGRVSSVRESASAFLEVRAEPGAAPATARIVLLLDGWMDGPRPPDGRAP